MQIYIFYSKQGFFVILYLLQNHNILNNLQLYTGSSSCQKFVKYLCQKWTVLSNLQGLPSTKMFNAVKNKIKVLIKANSTPKHRILCQCVQISLLGTVDSNGQMKPAPMQIFQNLKLPRIIK